MGIETTILYIFFFYCNKKKKPRERELYSVFGKVINKKNIYIISLKVHFEIDCGKKKICLEKIPPFFFFLKQNT